MKKVINKGTLISFLALVILSACNISKSTTSDKSSTAKLNIVNDTTPKDSVEYELIIIDPGFDTWLSVYAKPINFYDQKYYESKNLFFVNEWNSRYNRGVRPDLYSSYIDYVPGIDYGLELNYKLYNYFLYFEKTNGVNLSY